jgi:hypothetical protein
LKIVKQNLTINKLNGEVEQREVIHMYSERGGFTKGGLYMGDHIQLGEGASIDDYEEVDMDKENYIPDYLEPIVINEEPERKNEETIEERYKREEYERRMREQ